MFGLIQISSEDRLTVEKVFCSGVFLKQGGAFLIIARLRRITVFPSLLVSYVLPEDICIFIYM